MESCSNIIVPILRGLLILLPIIFFLFLRDIKKFKLIYYLFFTLTFGIIFSFLTAKYSNSKDENFLKQYSVQTEYSGFKVEYSLVPAENLEKVKNLERSLMGIGWPLKVMMSIPLYLFYILVLYFPLELMRKGILQQKLE